MSPQTLPRITTFFVVTGSFLFTVVHFLSFSYLFSMIDTNIICWNCREISSRDTSSRVLRLIQKYKLMKVCLVETRANDDRFDRFCTKLLRSWNWVVLSAIGFIRGILVA